MGSFAMEKDHDLSRLWSIGRFVWMVLGPMFLALTANHIFLNGTGWHTPADYVFFATLAVMILGRWLEVLQRIPLTSISQPATRKDFYLYAAFVFSAGLTIWIIANAFGNHGRAQLE
jgi:hypothetical protein